MSAFFFDTRGPKKKAWQKRNAAKGISPLRRRPTLRALDQRRLLKKAGENFCADIAVKSPTNQNLNALGTVPFGTVPKTLFLMAATGDEKKSDDKDPDPVVVEKTAKTVVIHKISSLGEM